MTKKQIGAILTPLLAAVAIAVHSIAAHGAVDDHLHLAAAPVWIAVVVAALNALGVPVTAPDSK